MTVTLELEPELEQGLLAQASERGVSVGTYLQEILGKQVRVAATPAQKGKIPELPIRHLGAVASLHGRDFYLDWSQCAAVESIPGKRSGAWVFRDTRTPVSVVFDNLEVGASIEEIMEWFHLSHKQVIDVIEFAARSLDAPTPSQHRPSAVDAHPV